MDSAISLVLACSISISLCLCISLSLSLLSRSAQVAAAVVAPNKGTSAGLGEAVRLGESGLGRGK